MSTRKKTIACFGATGGCVGAALVCALKEGHYCTALVRTPEKLRNFLANGHDIPPSAVDQRLTIFRGDVKDSAAVAKALISPLDKEAFVDVILSAAKLQSTSGKPVEKPLLIPISTVGCGRRRGIPLSIYLPYHYLLGSPLADKLRMEEVVLKDKGAHVRDFVIMRPPFLTDGEARGDSVLRVGWEWGAERNDQAVKEPGPEIGYYVSRKDIGAWIFQKVVVQGGWEGKCVYLTY